MSDYVDLARSRRTRLVQRAGVLLACSAATLGSNSALAYWELIPQLDTGLTWEENPRYISDSAKDIAEEAAPGITDSATGTFIEPALFGSYQTPSSRILLAPRIRKTEFLKSNKDLNSDSWSINLSALHQDQRGEVGISASIQEADVRTGEFESATPENPNAPPETSGGSGRFTQDDTQNTRSVQPYLSYRLSPRNTVQLSFDASDVEYDQPSDPALPDLPLSGGYLDYTYKQTVLNINHYLNDKNFIQVSLNGGAFDSDDPDSEYSNSTESFGVGAAYNLVITPTLSANANIGVSRSSVNVVGLPFDPLTGAFCPPDALCSASDDERNFVGDIGLRKRSELTTMNMNISRSLAPRSNGTEVVQDQARFYIDRTVSQRLTVSAGAIYSEESAVAGSDREDRTYLTIDTSLKWSLTPTLSAYGKYTYISDEDNLPTGNFTQVNHRVFFGVIYRGVGWRR